MSWMPGKAKWRLLVIGAYRFAPPDNTSNFSTDVSATLPNALNHHVYLPRTLAGIHVRVLEKRVVDMLAHFFAIPDPAHRVKLRYRYPLRPQASSRYVPVWR